MSPNELWLGGGELDVGVRVSALWARAVCVARLVVGVVSEKWGGEKEETEPSSDLGGLVNLLLLPTKLAINEQEVGILLLPELGNRIEGIVAA